MSTATWYLIRYMPDLARREPRNVGVVLRGSDGEWLTKFMGEKNDGSIDGRRLRHDIDSEVYKTWVDYYRRKAADDAWSDVERMQLKRVRNYFAEHGGEYLGRDKSWQVLLEDLFAELVEAAAVDSGSELRPERITSRVERILGDAGIMPEKNVHVPAKFGNELDEVPFKYRYHNGQVHLMDVLPASRKPSDAAAAARELMARVQGVQAAGHARSFVTFYDRDVFPEDQLKHILRPIQSVSHTVDIGRETLAVGEMRNLVGRGYRKRLE